MKLSNKICTLLWFDGWFGSFWMQPVLSLFDPYSLSSLDSKDSNTISSNCVVILPGGSLVSLITSGGHTHCMSH